jgi:DNA invertase Pin-like site-specific DNA recombinase
MRVATYTRVSTSEQPNGIAVQRQAITAEAERRGWSVSAEFVDAGYSAASMARPGITAALEALRAGEADVLVVAKLDRLSRSLDDFAQVMARAQREGWSVVALDADVDTTTPAGEAWSAFSPYSRSSSVALSRNARRTRWPSSGPKGCGSGRPPALDEAVVARIAAEREQHVPYRHIADALNRDGVPTAHGGSRWYASTVQRVATREALSPFRPLRGRATRLPNRADLAEYDARPRRRAQRT